MKLRQKLAVVLASAMVVTAVPVTTMAASANRITKTLTVAEDSNIGVEVTTTGAITVDNAPKLVVDLKDDMKQDDIFTIKITDGEFLDVNAYAAGNAAADANVEVTRISKNELQVKALKDVASVAGNDEITIPLYAKAKGEKVVVTINPENSTVSAGEFVIATTNAAKATVEIGELNSFYTEGEISEIKIEEAFTGAFKAEALKADNEMVEIQLTVENSDFQFVNGTGKATLGRGFAAKEVKVEVGSDKQVATIKVAAADLAATARGNMTITGLNVETVKGVKAPQTGELQVSVSSDLVEDKAYTVANIQEYGVSLTVQDNKPVEFVAGNTKAVKFVLKENVAESIVGNRTIEFTLDNGYFTTDSIIKLGTETIAKLDEAAVEAEVSTVGDVTTNLIIEKINGVKRVVGFEITAKDGVEKYEITADVDAAVDFAGDIKVKAEGRAIDEELETVIATVKAPFTVETEAATLKVGLKDQKAGKIVITETEKGMLQKEDIIISFEQEKGMNFTTEPTVETTGDIKVGKAELIKEDGQVVGVKVPVTRTSKEASTITISGFGIDVDRTVAEGNFDATIGGKAIAKNGTAIKAENFVVVGTPNTEDMVNGMKKGTASFVVGSKEYTVNGTAKEMDAAAYITAAGRTMLPIRYVSEAFGIDGNNIIFTKADGTITILAGNRTLQLKNGSNIAVLNGAQIKMDEKVTIKDGRTFVPVGEIGRLLGVSVSFDDATKTATFTNK